MFSAGPEGQGAAAALLTLALLLALGVGLAEVGLLAAAADRAARAAEVGVMAGLSRRDFPASQACGCPRLLPDAADAAEAALDRALEPGWPRACLADSVGVTCTVTAAVRLPLASLLGLPREVGLVRTRQGRLEFDAGGRP